MADEKEGRQEIRKQAQQAAADAGRKWAELSKEERKPFVQQARKAIRKSGNREAALKGAREAAERAGKKWSELSSEQRKAFRQEAAAAAKAERQAQREARSKAQQ